MKILMFGWEFPPFNSGGLGTACHGLTRALVGKKVDVKFVLPHALEYEDDWLDFVFAGTGKMKRKYIRSLLSPYMTPSEYVQWKMKGGSGEAPFTQSLVEEVYRYASLAGDIAASAGHDIIHAHEWLAFLAGVEARKSSKKPYIAHVHSTEMDRSGGYGNPAVRAIEEEGLKRADHIIAVSQYTKDIVMKEYAIPTQRIDVVHNGVHQPGSPDHTFVEPDRLSSLKKMGYKIVLYAGRLTLHKGPDYFMRAARRVLDYYPKVMFVIAGSGDMEYQLVEMTAHLNMSHNVIFTGWLRGNELAHMFEAADLYVLPSVSEPFGIAPLEAITYGTPVLVSKQSGISETFKHALKTDFWDIDEMAQKIVSVLEHESLHSELQENSLHEVKRFNWDAAAEKCLHVYDKVLGSEMSPLYT